jgi:four helix bundle protein
MFEGLRVYQAAELLDSIVLDLIEQIPRGFSSDVDQLRRAAGSCPYNIAEATGSEQPGKKINHLEIARGSVDEVRAILRRLVRGGALTKAQIQRPCTLSRTIAKMLTSWIAKLQ